MIDVLWPNKSLIYQHVYAFKNLAVTEVNGQFLYHTRVFLR